MTTTMMAAGASRALIDPIRASGATIHWPTSHYRMSRNNALKSICNDGSNRSRVLRENQSSVRWREILAIFDNVSRRDTLNIAKIAAHLSSER